jgi:O-succinylbenzoic acid--CoA ligase
MVVEAWLERAAFAAPAMTAIETPGGSCFYAELLLRARAGAHHLVEGGVRRGERVALALPAGLDFAYALHACLLLGAVAVPVDLRLGARERGAITDGAAVVVDEPLHLESGTDGAVLDGGVADWSALGDVAAGGVALDGGVLGGVAPAVGASTFDASTAGVEAPDHADRPVDGVHDGDARATVHDLDAVAAIIHTSGTTAAPRPVELTYGNFLWSALGSAVALGLDPRERWLCNLPLSHVGGLSILMRSAIYATTAVVHERFDTDLALAALMADAVPHDRGGGSADARRPRPVTLVSLVATTLARLLDAGLERPPALRCALTGGGPVPAALLARAREAGVPVSLTYGLTEACSQVTTLAPAGAGTSAVMGPPPGTGTFAVRGTPAGTGTFAVRGTPAGTGTFAVRGTPAAMGTPAVMGTSAAAVTQAPEAPTAGPPLFCTRVRISPQGEIEVAGPTLARGVADDDGWLRTGDLGRLNEEGNLQVTGRKADTIVSGGENVAPTEVEAVLEEHPGVLESAVVGRVDEQWGEAVTALVVLRAGADDVTGEVLRAHCATRLAPYKVPKQVALVAGPLPRTRSGKLLRRELLGGEPLGGEPLGGEPLRGEPLRGEALGGELPRGDLLRGDLT